jgi:Fe2+ transport system protein FeoA
MKTLEDLKAKQKGIVKEVKDKELSNHLIRFGIGKGSKITCNEKIPLGPIIIKFNLQEIAIARNLAKMVVLK